MRFVILTFYIFFQFVGNDCFSQFVHITAVDNKDFPLIHIKVEFVKTQPVDFNKLSILEKGETTIFSIDSTTTADVKNVYCLLVEERLLMDSVYFEIVNELTSLVIKKLNHKDLFNILLPRQISNEEKCIFPLSFEFTSNYEGLLQYVSEFRSSHKQSEINSDLPCAIDASLDVLSTKENNPARKMLIVFYQPDNKKFIDWATLKIKAKEQKTGLCIIEFPVKENLNIDLNWQNVLNSKVDSIEILYPANLDSKKSYLLSFYTNQTAKLNQFELRYGNELIRGSFAKEVYQGSFQQYALLAGIIAFLFLLSIYLYFNLVSLKRRLKKQVVGPIQKKAIFSKLNQLHGEPYNPNKTNYGSASITPYITVDLEGGVDNYELKKLRTTIGRHSDNDILLAHLTVSNHHAIITNEGGVYYIQDNESTNGTFVNDIKVTKSEIKNGDTLRLGKVKIFLTF